MRHSDYQERAATVTVQVQHIKSRFVSMASTVSPAISNADIWRLTVTGRKLWLLVKLAAQLVTDRVEKLHVALLAVFRHGCDKGLYDQLTCLVRSCCKNLFSGLASSTRVREQKTHI